MATLRLTADLEAIASTLKGLTSADIQLKRGGDGQPLTLEISPKSFPITMRVDLPLAELEGQSISALSLPLRVSVKFTEGGAQFSKLLGLLERIKIETCEIRNGSLTIELGVVK